MMHKTLAYSDENGDSVISRHVSCTGLRFRFLVMALSLLQSSVIANTIAKCVLRERIYYIALDYFTLSSRTPTQSYVELREDLKYILEFWNRIVAEKKYLKEENFAFNSTGSNLMSFSVNTATPDGSMTGVVMDNEPAVQATNANQIPLGNSVTYNSVSGGISETNSSAGNPTQPVIAGSSALGQLVMSTNMFIEPSMAGIGTATNGTNAVSNLSRVDSMMTSNSAPHYTKYELNLLINKIKMILLLHKLNQMINEKWKEDFIIQSFLYHLKIFNLAFNINAKLKIY